MKYTRKRFPALTAIGNVVSSGPRRRQWRNTHILTHNRKIFKISGIWKFNWFIYFPFLLMIYFWFSIELFCSIKNHCYACCS